MRRGGNRIHDARAGVVSLEGERRASVVGIAIHIEQHETVVIACVVCRMCYTAAFVVNEYAYDVVGIIARFAEDGECSDDAHRTLVLTLVYCPVRLVALDGDGERERCGYAVVAGEIHRLLILAHRRGLRYLESDRLRGKRIDGAILRACLEPRRQSAEGPHLLLSTLVGERSLEGVALAYPLRRLHGVLAPRQLIVVDISAPAYRQREVAVGVAQVAHGEVDRAGSHGGGRLVEGDDNLVVACRERIVDVGL